MEETTTTLQTRESPRVDKQTILSVRNLHTYFFTRYGTVRAVQGVSFDLYQGEILGLVGESGSGKSVAVSSIMRLIPTPPGRILGGEVLLDGKDLLQISEGEMRSHRGRDLGMILQDPLSSLNPSYTVGEQIAEPLRVHEHLDGEELWKRVVDLLRRVRVPTPELRIKDYPHQFSGGMRQRVMASIAVAATPRILIADEPTTALDVTIQIQFLQLLQSLQRESGMSIVYITHDLGVVAEICDRVAVMYAGRIVELGDVYRIFARPAHPYTKALIAAVPTLGDQREELYVIEGQPPDLTQTMVGCPFAPRCEYAMPICTEEAPPKVDLGDGAYALCWKVAEEQ